MKKLLLIAVLVFCGCATVKLSDSGKAVRLLTALSPGDKAEEVGTISCKSGLNTTEIAHNIESCRNEIRNRASEMGATFVVIESQQLGNAWCQACVYMTGTAYK